MKKVLLSVFALTNIFTVLAQPGSLDLTFDGDGFQLGDLGDDYGNCLAIQSDGKIVSAGYSYNGSDYDFSVVRLNADGSFDSTFDTDGKLLADFGGFDQSANSIGIQSDGKIVVVGTTFNGLNNDIMIMRFLTDGSFDTSFDGDGIRIIDIGISVDYGRTVAIQSDDKIVVAGSTNDNPTLDFALIRLNGDGSFDTGFDSDGWLTTDIDGYDDVARALTIQADGKIIAVGNGYSGIDSDFAIARYNADGSLDNSFNFDGKLVTDFGTNDDIGNCITLQSDGKIILGGYTFNGVDNDFAAVRYSSTGVLDASFDTDGRVTTNHSGYEDQGFGIQVMSNGDIVIAGNASDGSVNGIGIVVYETNGSLNLNYDSDGKIYSNFMNETYGQAVAIQSDGKILAAGYGYGFAGSDFVIARYQAECSLVATVTALDFTWTCDQSGATYQWLDCSNGYAQITGQTGQSYFNLSGGDYAVEVTLNGCIDTSDCYLIIGGGFFENESDLIDVYPNPTNGNFSVIIPEFIEEYQLILTDISGKLIYSAENSLDINVLIDLSNEANGIYFLHLSSDQFSGRVKIIKE